MDTVADVRAVELAVRHGPDSATLSYRAFSDAVPLPSAWARGHFESCGLFDARIVHAGRERQLKAVGFGDHSWGRRDYSTILATRFVTVIFSSRLYLLVTWAVTPEGRLEPFGWIFDHGEFHAIQTATCEVLIRDDGITPVAMEALLWTDAGLGYSLEGQVLTAQMSTYHDDYFAVNTLVRFELGGYVGGGNLGLTELRRPTRTQLAALGVTATTHADGTT